VGLLDLDAGSLSQETPLNRGEDFCERFEIGTVFGDFAFEFGARSWACRSGAEAA
jgi:hypothetical protein